MCEHCRNIQIWRKFDAPKDYLACIAYIQQLVGQGEFELIAEESTCPSDIHLRSQHLARQRTLQKRQRMKQKRR